MIYLFGFLPVDRLYSQTFDPAFTSGPEVIEYAAIKLDQTLQELAFDSKKHPGHTDPDTGRWITFSHHDWTSGYFSGMLWYMYQLTGESKWRESARKWTEDLEPMALYAGDHDNGVRIHYSFGNGYKLTGDRKYRQIALLAAGTLSSRYDPAIGAIKSWEPWKELNATYPVIIDNLMNLELLFWAAKEGKNQEFHEIAHAHARTTMHHHLRADGSTYHIVDFGDNGTVNRKFTVQGYGPESVWSRGQAWAIYGFTMAYRYTGDPELLEAANAAATWYLDHLPEDHIPWYDFRDPSIPYTTKDASSAAIAASALIELYSFTDENRFIRGAENILRSLFDTSYSNIDSAGSSMLMRSTRYRGDAERGTIYADYYFLEAVLRHQVLVGVPLPDIELQTSLFLEQNYPNPFQTRTRINYSIETPGHVELLLYDTSGKLVSPLLNQYRDPGFYQYDLALQSLASGIYIYVLKADGHMEARKMVVIR
ncbi:MAG: T9SS type A sorting domain-containing protein [Balneolaceae bacterium]